MKKLILTIVSAALLYTTGMAQNKTVEVKNNKREMTRGANANIKSDVPTKDVEQAIPAGYKKPDAVRGANVSNLTRSKFVATRGTNENIKKDEPTKDVEKVRPSYSKPKGVEVKKSTANKMRGASTSIIKDEPTTDTEVAKPAGHEEPNTKGRSVKHVTRKAVDKQRGANSNIKMDVPSVDVEQARPGK
jgi:hypothetical protein